MMCSFLLVFLPLCLCQIRQHAINGNITQVFHRSLLTSTLDYQSLPLPEYTLIGAAKRSTSLLLARNQPEQRTTPVPLSLYDVAPYQYEGKLFFRVGWNHWSTCSATVVDENIIITAAHCVENGSGGRSYTDFYFVPQFREFRGEYLYPKGYYAGVSSVVHPLYTESGDVNRDVAFIRLSDDLLGTGSVMHRIGGIAKLPSPSEACLTVSDLTATMLGYPGQPSSKFDGRLMIRTFTTIVARTNYFGDPPMWVYASDQRQGCSGGGVFGHPRKVCTVNSSSMKSSSGEFVVGPKIDSAVLDLMKML